MKLYSIRILRPDYNRVNTVFELYIYRANLAIASHFLCDVYPFLCPSFSNSALWYPSSRLYYLLLLYFVVDISGEGSCQEQNSKDGKCRKSI